MFSALPERAMLSVRGVLLFAWLVLIASLIWDPFSAQLTQPDATGSPFSISAEPILVQDQELISKPYQLGNRLFWTMIVPILPLFLMVFGHEAWRRICPLSLASQIPGYLGLRRRFMAFERRTGLIKATIPLINRNGWLERNSWYVQFAFLFLGIVARLLLINSDRVALAAALLLVIGAAMMTGVLWGGKTWCNFFCPANIVQKIYTEPRGILESNPHFSRPSLPQSMCRKPTKHGDVSACVACKANCGDIDLQRSYWSGVTDLARRNVYYMFFGLIVGFYGFYYLYSGSWDYYFSGIWTHEEGVRAKLMQPGIFLFGQAIAIPKFLTAPLILMLSCGASLLLGRLMEATYRKVRLRRVLLSEQLIVHHCLCVSAWLSINAFYLFGGRPNILLLPSLDVRIVDIIIVALTTLWLKQALQQSPEQYQQESMAAGLLQQLKSLRLDGNAFPDNRNIENLRPNELYVLAKALPAFSQREKQEAYREMLNEQIRTGTTGSKISQKLFDDFRKQLNITEEDHNRLLDELGGSESATIHTEDLTTEERATAISQYRAILDDLLVSRLEQGALVPDILADDAVKAVLSVMRQSLQIGDAEHDTSVNWLFTGGTVGKKMEASLDALFRHKSLLLCLETAELYDPLGSSLMEMLLDHLEAREQSLCLVALSLLRNYPTDFHARAVAEDLASLGGPTLRLLLRQPIRHAHPTRWRDVFQAGVLDIFQLIQPDDSEAYELTSGTGARTHREVVAASADIERNFLEVLTLDDPTIRAIGLTVFSYIAPELGKNLASDLVKDPETKFYPMLHSAANHVAGIQAALPATGTRAIFNATVRYAGQSRVVRLDKARVSVGRDSNNDIVMADPAVWTYHAEITAQYGEVRLARVDDAIVFVNGVRVHGEPVVVTRQSTITLGGTGAAAPRIVIDWENDIEAGDAMHIHPIHRLAILARNAGLRRLAPEALGKIAFESQAVRYRRGDRLEGIVGGARQFLVHTGQVKLFDPALMSFLPGVAYKAGDLFCYRPGFPDTPYFPEIDSDVSVLLDVPSTPEVEYCATRLPTSARATATPSHQAPSQRDQFTSDVL